MFSAIQYTPYTSTKFSANSHMLTVSSPWMSIAVELDEEHSKILANPVFFKNQSDSKLQALYAFFKEFPLFNVLPRGFSSKNINALDAADENLALISKNPTELISTICNGLGVSYDFNELFGNGYEWPEDELLDYSRMPVSSDCYDPYAVYTYIRYLRLKHQFAKLEDAALVIDYLKCLREKNEGFFFDAVTDVMCQQYYVTSKCTDCLCPALGNRYIKDAVVAYIAEEQNHDRLILSSIKEISSKPVQDFYFAPEIMIETGLIRYAAYVCPLSFSCLVSIMEGSSYPDHDPVGLLLLASSRPSSARGIEAHFQIKKTHNHTAIPETFVKNLPPVTKNVAISALRMTEIAIKLDAEMPCMLHARFKGKYVQ